MMLTITVYSTMIRVESNVFQKPTPPPVRTSIMFVVSTFFQEGAVWLPSTHGARILVSTWLLVGIICMSSYSGTLTAMLTVPNFAKPIDTVQDMVSQDIPWKIEYGSSLYQYYETAPSGINKRIFNEKSGTFKNAWKNRFEIMNGDFVGISDVLTIKKAMSWDFSVNGYCNLYLSRTAAKSPNPWAFPFQPKSPWLPKINYWINRLNEAGLVERWVNAETRNATLCLLSPSRSIGANILKPLDMNAASGPFLLLLGGLIIAFVIFLFELFFSSSRKRF